MRRPLLPAVLVTVVLLAGCSPSAQVTRGPDVTEAEARDAVRALVRTAAKGTPEAMRSLCRPNLCHGLSSSLEHEPLLAPGPEQPPSELCVVPLPATGPQAGAQVVVLQGTRGDGRDYVTQVLVERVDGELQVHEPGFWIGIRYTALDGGRAWSGASDVADLRAEQDARTRRACTDTEQWVREVRGA